MIAILYKDGGVKISFHNLPSELQKKYGCEPKKKTQGAEQVEDAQNRKETPPRGSGWTDTASGIVQIKEGDEIIIKAKVIKINNDVPIWQWI